MKADALREINPGEAIEFYDMSLKKKQIIEVHIKKAETIKEMGSSGKSIRNILKEVEKHFDPRDSKYSAIIARAYRLMLDYVDQDRRILDIPVKNDGRFPGKIRGLLLGTRNYSASYWLERGWISESDESKECLTIAIMIDPHNMEARKALSKEEEQHLEFIRSRKLKDMSDRA